LGRFGSYVVEDAVEDACVEVVLDLHAAHGVSTFGGFVLGKYLNARKKAWRAQEAVRTQPLGPEDAYVGDPPDAEEEPDPDELAALRQCLEHLPQREQRAVALRYFEDAPSERIAAELGVRRGNARMLVNRGVTHLKECLGVVKAA
jgi:RNA polymerase sigma-70 factor (ECF subfamily)